MLRGFVVCLVSVGAVIVSVVAGGCPGVSGAGLLVKQRLPGVGAVAMTMSLVLPVEEGIDLCAGWVGEDNDASPVDEVTGWLPAARWWTGWSGVLRCPALRWSVSGLDRSPWMSRHPPGPARARGDGHSGW